MNQNVKIGVASAALLLGVGLLGWYFLNKGPDGGPTGKQPFVNVTTGEVVYLMQGSDFKTLPAADKSGKFTLFPIEKDDSGDWILKEKYRGGIELGLKEGWFTQDQLKFDAETFKVSAGG